MLRKPRLYNKAIILRHKGLSYNEILEYIPVAQSTISRWCHRILLTEKQKERLVEKKRNTPLICSVRKQAARSKKEAKVWAKEQVSKISSNEESLLITGAALYWAEGTKSGGGGLVFTNTDPYMIKIMMRFFREIVCIQEDKFRIIVRVREKEVVKSAERYWAKTTKVPQVNFRRPEIIALSKNNNANKYPYGICRVSVYSNSLRNKMVALTEEFSKKF